MSLQLQCDLCGEDPESPPRSQAIESHQQSQRAEGAAPLSLLTSYFFQMAVKPRRTPWFWSCNRAEPPVLELALFNDDCCISARGPVCVCGHPDHWKHHDCHNSPAVHVRLHRSAALQGEDSCFILMNPTVCMINRKSFLTLVLGKIFSLHRRGQTHPRTMQVRLKR